MTLPLQLTDEQWCFLDLLIRAKQKGVHLVNRNELLNSPSLPDAAKVRLVWAGLMLANTELVTMQGQHNFKITEAGVRAFNTKFGKGEEAAKPTAVADVVIALPDRTREALH